MAQDIPAVLKATKMTVEVSAQALLDAVWLARVERSNRKVDGFARHTSVSDASLEEFIEAGSKALRGSLPNADAIVASL